MRNFYTSFLLLCTIFLLPDSIASPIDSLRASKVATNFMSQYAERYDGVEFYYKNTNSENVVMYYVFNLKNADGYVIVVADDACFPILGYSTESKFDLNNLPIQLNKWLWHRAKEVAFIKEKGLEADADIKQKWEEIESSPAAFARTKKTEGVNPLLSTKWDQSPFYNDLCPFDIQENERTITGCVATAMAQIMKYHNHPKTGQGIYSYTHDKYGILSADFASTTYDWANMPNEVTSKNTAVATLMYHCGISVDMDYNLGRNGGSGAYPINIESAFKKYFGYDETTKYIESRNYSATSWRNLLKAELDSKRPIEYNGFGTGGGHAFVCDGYDDNNFFHFNWGWGGFRDGYFNISALNPESVGTGGGDGGYNSNQSAIIGIKPAPNSSTNLQLTTKITITPNPIEFGEEITVSFNLANRGSSTFVGDYGVALFDSDFRFVSFVGELKTNRSLDAGFTYTNELVFNDSSTFLSEGDYYIGAYYRELQKEWQIFPNSTHESFIKVKANNVNAALSMYGTSLKVSSDPIIRNQPFEVTFNIANFKETDFEGNLALRLYDLQGQFVKEIENKSNLVLGSNKTFSNPLIFKTSGLDIPIGTYLLAPSYKEKSSNTYYILEAYRDSNGIYPNLVRVNVAAPGLSLDTYEPNNTENQAYTLSINFSNNTAIVNTQGSNLHIGTDVDYYKLNLPNGYDYELTARLHDSDNSGNGQSYTVDALFSYKFGNSNTSDAFDVSIGENNSKVSINNGGTIIFKVAPYFVGDKGSYLLDIQVSRKAAVIPEIAITSPKNGDSWETETTQQISWTDNISENVRIDLLRTDNTFIESISSSTLSNGQFSWQVPDLAEGNYKIGIASISNNSVFAISPIFSITKKRFINITSPKNGDSWETETTQQISWADNISENVRIDLLRTDNTFIESISSSTPSNGQFSWQVPDLAEGNYKIGIASITNNSVFAISPVFNITKKRFINITSPKDGDKWETKATRQITWTDNVNENVKIDLLRTDNTVVGIISSSTPSNGQFSWSVPDLADGNYKIRIASIANSSLSAVSPMFSIFSVVTGVENTKFSSKINVYPNPTSGMLAIEFPENTIVSQLRLFNSVGKELWSNDNNVSGNAQINMANYPSGVYFLHVIGNENEIGVKKIVLER